MTTPTDPQKTIRIVTFSGKVADWNRWSKTFLAMETARGLREVLKPTDAAKDQGSGDNEKVYSDLMLACQEDVVFGIVDEASSDKFPDGDARVAWKKLNAKFEPKTGANKVQLKSEFQRMKLMDPDDDPDEWITALELLRRRLKTLKVEINDEDFMLHILNNIPQKEYETTIEMSEKELSNSTLTLQNLKESLIAKYRRNQRAKEDMNDFALFTGKQFKGMCNVCGKIGHKGTDCFTLPQNAKKKQEYIEKLNKKKGGKKGKNKNKTGGVICHGCGKPGHIRPNCPDKIKDDENKDTAAAAVDEEMILFTSDNATEHALATVTEGKLKSTTWVADSGASVHITNSAVGFKNYTISNKDIIVGNGLTMQVKHVGDWSGSIKGKDGKNKDVTLKNVHFIPDAICNLFSLTAAMTKGWKLFGDKNGIGIRNGNQEINFGDKIQSPKGTIFGVDIQPSVESSFLARSPSKLAYKQAHAILGHFGKDIVKTTAKAHGWQLIDSDNDEKTQCNGCTVSKAKRVNMEKESTNKSTIAGQRLMIDTSSIKGTKGKANKFWLLVIDEATSMKWSYFLPNKDGQVSVLIALIKELRTKKPNAVECIRCDNAGENYSLQKECEKQGLGVTFEFTARSTPQQNGKVERWFATLYNSLRAMMISAGFEEARRNELWTEAAATVTKISNVLVSKGDEMCSYQKFYGSKPDFIKHMRIFGELGVVTQDPGSKIKAKLKDRGVLCMFLGYAKDHAGGVYRMLNLQTRKVWLTRDVYWTRKMYAHKTKKSLEVFYAEVEDEDNNRPRQEQQPPPEEDNQDELQLNDQDEAEEEDDRVQEEPRPAKIPRAVAALQSYNNPGQKEVLFCFHVQDPNPEDHINKTEPVTFQEAWNHPDEDECNKWRDAIRLEYKNMIKKMVWERKGIMTLPPSRKGLGAKWVFKIKKNGVYRARLVAKGYDQQAGVDFQYNFAPVTSEVTLRILLILWLVKDYYAEVADVQTAFLHGELEEEVFLKIPQGYKEYLSEIGETCEGSYLKLNKTIYGLVQAARQWWKKFTEVLTKDLKFQQFPSDTCLLKRHTDGGTAYLIMYVDDCLVIGDKAAVMNALHDIQLHFNITRSDKIEDFIGCTIEKKDHHVTLSQPDLIRRLLMKFEDKISNLKDFDTPAGTGVRVIRPTTEEEKLSEAEQTEYRAGVGSLLYLLKHSRPDLSNSVRELTKAMDGANKAHQKMLYRVIKYVDSTKGRALVLKPTKTIKWTMKAFSDSDFAGDTDTRRSVSGFVIYVNDSPIAWRSRGQKSVSLSSTESEYIATSEVAMEILYIARMMEFLDVSIDYPITVHVDNIGAIYLATSAKTGNRTKHVDTRYHFVREFVEQGVLKIVFVRSADNTADVMTKNLCLELYDKHTQSLFTRVD